MNTELLFTTNPGLEDLAERELATRMRAEGLGAPASEIQPSGSRGHLLSQIPCSLDQILPLLPRMRSVHHISRLLHRFSLPQTDPIDAIKRETGACEIPEMRTAKSFRVTAERHGNHPFTSQDVAGAAGAALVERYGTRVDLENYELNVRVEVHNRNCWISLPVTRESLNKRHKQIYNPRFGLQPVVAYGLLTLAELEDRGALLDPFCGGGTIVFEAAELFSRLNIYGSDTNRRAVNGARENAVAQGPSDRIHLQKRRAQDIGKIYSDIRFQAVVTNPPFGLGLGRHLNFYWLYRDFLTEVPRVLEPGGRVVVLVWKRGLFNQVLKDLNTYCTAHKRIVEMGGVHPAVYVLKLKS